MKKILFSLFAAGALFSADALKAQAVIFEDSFDTYTDFAIANVGSWTLTDVDLKTTYGFQGITFPNTQVAKSFQVFNSTTTTPVMTSTETSNWTARTGDKMMVAFAATSSPWNNDWLISPQIQITASGASLSFWAKGCDSDYGAEKFKVLVSTAGTAVADFTAVSSVTTTPSDAEWHEYTYNLNSYAGQQVYIAIQCTSEDQFGFAIDDFKVTSSVPATTAPSCSTLTTPANAATGVSVASPTLTWAASAGADSYDVYFDTNPNPTTLVGNVPGTSYTVAGNLALSTTYYWKVIPKNSIGAATGCTVYSFTTAATLPYCGPLAFTFTVEPITLVNFAGINNSTSASTTGGTAHEFFLDQVGNVSKSSTYTITLKGNSGGNYANNYMVFIDWNQDGDFADADEAYSAGTITNSTGTDTKQLTYDITVPAGALEGTTRLRVKKLFGTTNLANPCTGGSFGQAEDYTLNVSSLVAVSEVSKNGIKAYPNPVKDIFNIEAQGKIKSVKVYDVTGKQLLTKELNEVKSQIDFSKFNAGVYVVTTTLVDGTSTSTKVIKK